MMDIFSWCYFGFSIGLVCTIFSSMLHHATDKTAFKVMFLFGVVLIIFSPLILIQEYNRMSEICGYEKCEDMRYNEDMTKISCCGCYNYDEFGKKAYWIGQPEASDCFIKELE